MYQIGDFSIISRLSIKTLRYYHECGLLEPRSIDPDSGYRYYDEKSLQRARILHELKELDFSIKEIKELLDRCTDDSQLLDYMVHKQSEIRKKIANYDVMEKKLAVFIKQTRQAEEVCVLNMNKEIVIKEVLDVLVFSIRFRGKYQEAGEYFHKLFKYCGRHSNGSPFFLYYDSEFKEDNADIEACVPVKVPIEAGGMKSRILKGGQALTMIHKGPYETLGGSYKVLIDYINENDIKILSPGREIYLKGPGMILPRSPRKFITEIQMLVNPKPA